MLTQRSGRGGGVSARGREASRAAGQGCAGCAEISQWSAITALTPPMGRHGGRTSSAPCRLGKCTEQGKALQGDNLDFVWGDEAKISGEEFYPQIRTDFHRFQMRRSENLCEYVNIGGYRLFGFGSMLYTSCKEATSDGETQLVSPFGDSFMLRADSWGNALVVPHKSQRPTIPAPTGA